MLEVHNVLIMRKKRQKVVHEYLMMKLQDEDWKGVAKAAMELVEIKRSIEVLDHLGGSPMSNAGIRSK